jgi:hypothetical protein
VNRYGAGVGFYHFGEKFAWRFGGTGVRDGLNQSARFDGSIRKLNPPDMWESWFQMPDYARFLQKPD